MRHRTEDLSRFAKKHLRCAHFFFDQIVAKDHVLTFVESYLEAAGLIAAMKAGIHPSSVSRPLARTPVVPY